LSVVGGREIFSERPATDWPAHRQPSEEVPVRKRTGNRDVIVVEREGGATVWWFLVGGALGAGLALLFAPGSGEETRRNISSRLTKIRESAEGVLDEIRGKLDPDERVHRSLSEADSDGDSEDADDAPEGAAARRSGSGGRASSSARQELEQRLADARARRQRAMAEEDEEPVA
jgi:gas vesicle protein